ncbi:MAG: DUF721 domain-containing protein [Bacteroidales bacterium]|nr:DUF721 domain-containing protein [Bacteroidales bacterium]
MKRRNSQTLAEVLQQVLKTQHLDARLNEVRLIKLWPEVVGKSLAAQTENLYIKNGVLHLHVRSAIVRNELMLIRQSLVEKLNQAVGAQTVHDIVLR